MNKNQRTRGKKKWKSFDFGQTQRRYVRVLHTKSMRRPRDTKNKIKFKCFLLFNIPVWHTDINFRTKIVSIFLPWPDRRKRNEKKKLWWKIREHQTWKRIKHERFVVLTLSLSLAFSPANMRLMYSCCRNGRSET